MKNVRTHVIITLLLSGLAFAEDAEQTGVGAAFLKAVDACAVSVEVENAAFESGTKGWKVSRGKPSPLPKAGVDGTGTVVLEGASMTRSVEVSRGEVDLKRGHYRVTVQVRQASKTPGRATLGLRTAGGTANRAIAAGEEWVTLAALVVTKVRTPGNVKDRLTIGLSCGSAPVLFDNLRVQAIPDTGLWLRLALSRPGKGTKQASVSFIRRHRNKNSSDPIQQRFHSGRRLPRVPRDGSFTPWTDLRPHLFGRDRSTVTIRLQNEKGGPCDAPLRIEFGGLTKDPVKPFGRRTDPDVEFDDDDIDDLAALETIASDGANRPKPSAVIWRGKVHSKAGLFTYLVPENMSLPKTFATGIRGVNDNIKARRERIIAELPKIPRPPAAIPVCVNLSRLNSLIGPEWVQAEYEILRRIGISIVSDNASYRAATEVPWSHHHVTLENVLARKPNGAKGNQKVVQLADEPGDGPVTAEHAGAFQAFLKRQGITPADVGFTDLTEVQPYIAEEDAPPPTAGPITTRRLHYYTRRFAAERTAAAFRKGTEKAGKLWPGCRTTVNFRSGVRNVLTSETADWFTFGRTKAVTMMWNEDWLNTYGWRRDGIQLIGYYTELMRTAGRKHDLPVGCYVIQMGHGLLKCHTALAHGSRFLHLWRYGPSYANYLPYSWSRSQTTVREIATFCRDLAAIEKTLVKARRERARTALLYAPNDPIWRRGRAENWRVYMALMHAQIPVDIVTEAEIEEDGILKNYQILYVTDVTVRRAALAKVADWHKQGGRLWLSGAAGTRDEFNSPCKSLDEAIGLTRSDRVGDRLALSESKVTVQPNTALAGQPKGSEISARFADGTAAVISRPRAWQACAYRPGSPYFGPIRANFNRSTQKTKGKIQGGWSAERRQWITTFAEQNGGRGTASSTVAGVEVIRYQEDAEDLIFVLNYAGSDPVQTTIKVRATQRPAAVLSVRKGALPFTYEEGSVVVRLPLGIADVLRLQWPREAK